MSGWSDERSRGSVYVTSGWGWRGTKQRKRSLSGDNNFSLYSTKFHYIFIYARIYNATSNSTIRSHVCCYRSHIHTHETLTCFIAFHCFYPGGFPSHHFISFPLISTWWLVIMVPFWLNNSIEWRGIPLHSEISWMRLEVQVWAKDKNVYLCLRILRSRGHKLPIWAALISSNID